MSLRTIAAAAVLSLSLPLFLLAADEGAPAAPPAADSLVDARLSSVKGKVLVFERTTPQGMPAVVGLPLEDGDRITVGPDSSAEISIDGESVIRLDQKTDFTLSSARRSGTIFHLSVGSFLAKLRKLASGENMEFRGPAAVAAVRGTELSVEATETESRVGVFDEGRVEVSNEAGKQVLEANQETRAAAGKAPGAAVQLQHFAERRDALDTLRERAKGLPARWKKLASGSRQDKRKSSLSKMRERAERQRREPSHEPKTKERREKPAPHKGK